MLCPKCKNEIKENIKYCTNCGTMVNHKKNNDTLENNCEKEKINIEKKISSNDNNADDFNYNDFFGDNESKNNNIDVDDFNYNDFFND